VLTASLAGMLAGAAVLCGSRPGPQVRLRAIAAGRPRQPIRRVVTGHLRRRREPPPDVAELAEQLAALSDAGLPWVRVWEVLARTPGAAQGMCTRVARQLAAGGTAAQALRADGGQPAVAWLAVACDLAERAGAPVADVLRRFAAAVRADDRAAADRDAALAGPRATAALLSWLPFGGVGLGLLIGTDPVATLLGTGPGRLCLATGAALWILGRRWTAFLVGRAAGAGG
jgi:tight adherence protein B